MPARSKIIFLFTVLIIYFPLQAQEENILFRENFNNLDNWKPLFFEKISQHTTYAVVNSGDKSCLKTESAASASALIFKEEFNVYKYPYARWRWKTENIYVKGNAKTREGDDYPIRIYIIFKFDPQRASFLERLKYKSAKLVYGQYPPQSSISYIWANREHKERIITSPYASRSQMVLLEEGRENVGRWVEEEVDILKDYEEAFGEKPPPLASIAIMNDSDNTGESATAYIDYLEIFVFRE